MSRHQLYAALRVASVPKGEFERLVESDKPPTVEKLARLGARKGTSGRRPTASPLEVARGQVQRLRAVVEAVVRADRDGLDLAVAELQPGDVGDSP